MKKLRRAGFWAASSLLGLLSFWGSAGAVRAATPTTQYLTSGWQLARMPDVAQNGTQISQTTFNSSAWLNAVVPGTVLTSYQNAGIIPDPYYSTNMFLLSQSGYYDTFYWYRNAFYVPSSYSGQKVWLNFSGINWQADVYLNGTYLGMIQGPFTRAKFDVTSLVTPGATNALAIQIYWCNATVWDTPTFVGAGGWDFTPEVAGRDVGLYSDVYLSTSGAVDIVDPFLVTTLPLPGTTPASLNLQVGLTNSAGIATSGTLVGSISPDGITFQTNLTVNASSFTNITLNPSTLPQLSITNPALWWPNGYGPQNLHSLQLTFQSAGSTSDLQTVSFGIRQFTYQTNGVEMQLSCNGQRIMCKGGNWGMPDAMLKFTPQQLDSAVQLHQQQNFTMIRCWHGTSDLTAFYDACDKYGIMVWDEFWLNGSNFGLGPTDPAMFITNSIDKYKRLRNRACLAVWCAENEASPPTNLMLQANYTKYDNSRIYVDASNIWPVHGGLGLYEELDPDYYFTHAYGFTTEIGSTCVPALETMQLMMPASSLWPPGDTNWQVHNWQYNISGYTNQVATSYGPLTDITNFCTKAQLLNYQTYRAIFEAWNGHMWNTPSTNPCSGVLIWMSQSAWPSIIWQTYDWFFNPTGGYFGSKKGCEPVHIQWDNDDNSVRIIDATTQSLSGASASIQVCNLNGVPQFTTNLAGLNVAADTVSNCFVISSGLTNLALNRPTYASSCDNTSDTNAYAVDGNLGTRWSSAYSDPQWFYVDLGSTQTLNNVTILWQTAAYGKAFQIRVSNDTTNWTTVWSTNNLQLNTSISSDWSTSAFTPVKARYVEMYGTSRASIWGYSMYEFQVYDMAASGNWMNNLSSTYFIRLKLNDGGGNLLSENFYWVGTNYLNYTALNSLPAANPACTAGYAITNGTTTITATVTNAGTNVAFDMVFKLMNQATGARVLPAIYSDNYFSLLPGEAETVTISFTNNSVSSGPLQLLLNGWNVASQAPLAFTLSPALPAISAPVALPSDTVDQWTTPSLVCSNWTGNPAYSFQWQFSTNGATYFDVAGATTNSLTLTNASPANSGYYQLIFSANGQTVTSSVAPITVLPGAGGATGPRLSIKLAADRNYNFDAITNGWPAGVLNTPKWFNLYGPTTSSNGFSPVTFYSVNGVTNPSGAVLVYNYSWEYNTINEQVPLPNNVALIDSYISMNDGWYLSLTNLDPVFTNSYNLYFYYQGINNGNVGGKNYIRYYAGRTTNTTVLGTREWNLYTTTTNRIQSFVQDMTPSNTSSATETPGANYFIITNLSGGAFDLFITNSFYGGVGAIEIVANAAASGSLLTASTNNAPQGTAITFTNKVSPAPPNGENVAFVDGNTIFGAGSVSGGLATLSTRGLSAGTHALTAVYGGDGNYLASTSSVLTLTVVANPTISAPVVLPATGLFAGMRVTLVCSNYTGAAPYSFQWQAGATSLNYTNVSGATTNLLVLTNATPANSGYYQLIFTASSQTVTSSPAYLTVKPPAVINALQTGGSLVLSWPQGVLLQATNLAGPWITNTATSPYTNLPSNPQMYYRVQLQ